MQYIDVYNVQLSNDRAEVLGKRLVASSNGAFEQCFFVSGGSEAMEAAIKVARGYFWEIGQPQRKYFIARHLSYHGNTLGALALSNHPARRTPYEAILEHDAFHHVSPAYYKRFAAEGESEEDYVKRLAQEVEDKFQELGPENVIGCEQIYYL
jgi:adenosylmethionine-8-amino-7-oxononanoate aminotransferase